MNPIKLLKVTDFEKETKLIQSSINQFFKKAIFNEMSNIAKNPFKENANVIIDAILQNKLYYNNDNTFTGNITSTISKALQSMGGRFVATGGFYIGYNQLSNGIKEAIKKAKDNREETTNNLIKFIDNFDVDTALSIVSVATIGLTLANKIDSYLNKKSKNLIPISTPTDKLKYTEDMKLRLDLSIKNFIQDKLKEFRKDIQQQINEGRRVENLSQYIKSQYKVSRSKAEFLANQETRIFLSDRQQQKSEQAGFNYFLWVHTDNDNPNRREVHYLWYQLSKDSIIFSFKKPPMNPKVNKRELPGVPCNCKCIAIAIAGKEVVENGVVYVISLDNKRFRLYQD